MLYGVLIPQALGGASPLWKGIQPRLMNSLMLAEGLHPEGT